MLTSLASKTYNYTGLYGTYATRSNQNREDQGESLRTSANLMWTLGDLVADLGDLVAGLGDLVADLGDLVG
jgi:hypothetical protein